MKLNKGKKQNMSKYLEYTLLFIIIFFLAYKE